MEENVSKFLRQERPLGGKQASLARETLGYHLRHRAPPRKAALSNPGREKDASGWTGPRCPHAGPIPATAGLLCRGRANVPEQQNLRHDHTQPRSAAGGALAGPASSRFLQPEGLASDRPLRSPSEGPSTRPAPSPGTAQDAAARRRPPSRPDQLTAQPLRRSRIQAPLSS